MRHDLAYLADMLEAAQLALRFVEGMTRDEFLRDAKTQAAVIREIEVIGEAAGRVCDEFRGLHPEIPWREAVSMRNRMIHGYDDIDLEIVWDALRVDIPELIQVVAPLVPPEGEV